MEKSKLLSSEKGNGGEKGRRRAFKRRREGVMKKARELSILCDTPVWIVIRSPDDDGDEVGIWPLPPENGSQQDEVIRQCKEKMMAMMKNGTGRGRAKKRARTAVPDVGDEETAAKRVRTAPDSDAADSEKCADSCYVPEPFQLFPPSFYSLDISTPLVGA
ncbi:unnamed protein product [Cuscuta campestris]|uniref:MADS-box domain-containing protein n=1 Tax=Cuscuta campestris TaxID=132261 RepID=A0A484N7A0_9ASTE|nr:unnamed protein product [Cuscuta campestris]VFQ97202.1 unnamed protein product [Cuscuta campestris]